MPETLFCFSLSSLNGLKDHLEFILFTSNLARRKIENVDKLSAPWTDHRVLTKLVALNLWSADPWVGGN